MSFLGDLPSRAAERGRILAFPEADEPRTARAIVTLLEEGIATPVAVGNAETVGVAIADAGGDAGAVRVIDPDGPDPHTIAGELVAAGEVDGAVAGAVASTATVLRAGLRTVGPDEGIRTVSSAFYMIVPPFRDGDAGADEEVLTFADAGVVQYPTAEQLAEIAVAAARARRAIVGDEPRVAFLSHSTKGSAEGESIDRVRAALLKFRELEPDVAADGELQGDAALIASVAERKAPGSPVGGRANVLIFPDLDSANIAYKLVQRITGGMALGPVVQGLRRPYNDLSRGATSEEIVRVACITALMG